MSEARTRTFEWSDPKLVASGIAGRSGLDYLRAMIAGEVPSAPITLALGFALTAAEPGYARFEGDVAEYQFNPMGSVHGGMACTMLDSALGCAVMTTLDDKSAYTTAQLNVNLTRAITLATGRMIAEGRIVHRGSRVATAEAKLLDPKGGLLAHATTTCLVFPRQ